MWSGPAHQLFEFCASHAPLNISSINEPCLAFGCSQPTFCTHPEASLTCKSSPPKCSSYTGESTSRFGLKPTASLTRACAGSGLDETVSHKQSETMKEFLRGIGVQDVKVRLYAVGHWGIVTCMHRNVSRTSLHSAMLTIFASIDVWNGRTDQQDTHCAMSGTLQIYALHVGH